MRIDKQLENSQSLLSGYIIENAFLVIGLCWDIAPCERFEDGIPD